MKGIRYISLHEHSGYGEAARRVMGCLRRAGVPLTWTPMVPGAGWKLGYEPFLGREIQNAGELGVACNRPMDVDTVIVHTVPEYFPLWRTELGADAASPLFVGHTVWETNRLPRSWPSLLGCCDGVLVPCSWNLSTFAGLGVPLGLLPHPPVFPRPSIASQEEHTPEPPTGTDRPFRFYSIGTWTTRKAMDLLIRAYLRAFSADDPVELVIKTSPEDFTRPRGRVAGTLFGRHRSSSAALAGLLAGVTRPAAVRLITRKVSGGEIAALHRSGECYVSLSRSEGWGLGAYDAAAFGNPVVTPGYGGQLDYLGAESAYLVDYRLVAVEDAQGGASYTADQTWAEPSVEHAATLLRQIFEFPDEARRRAAIASDAIYERFDPQRLVNELLDTTESFRRQRRAGAP